MVFGRARLAVGQRLERLSVTDYAEQIGVSAVTLYQWRRRLAASTAAADGRANMVEVTIARPRWVSSVECMIVRVGDGHRSIEVPRGFDGDDLRRLVTALESC